VTWLSWHERSERLASDAHTHARLGDHERALSLFAAAAEAESHALEELDVSKVRTVGITTVSAVSLWFKARQFAPAEQLALRWLASVHLPQFAVEQLRNLLQGIWTAQTIGSAGVSFLPGQVFVSVKGGQTVTGGAPLDLIIEKVQTVQALFYRTIEYMKGVPHRKRGAPSIDIQESCKPWLFQAPAGSYQFSVAIQEPLQPDFFKDAGPQPEHVALHFLSILQASSEDPNVQLPELVRSEDYRGTFLKLARNLAPTGKNFSQVEVRAADESQGISLGPENRKAINRVLRPPRTPLAETEEQAAEELHGVLRALNLEKDWLEVLMDGHIVHIDGLSETVDDTIGPMVNRPVIVQAKRKAKGGWQFVDIESED
jgi:hypothetical protein